MKKLWLGSGILLVIAATNFTTGYVGNIHKKEVIQKYLPHDNQNYVVYLFPTVMPGQNDPLVREVQTIFNKDKIDIEKVGLQGINFNPNDKQLLQILNINDPNIRLFVLDTQGKVVLQTGDPYDLDQYFQALII